MPTWIKDRLSAGEQLVGSFLQLASPAVAETMARSGGFDFLCVEGEHSALGPTEVAGIVRDVDLLGVPCLVRVAANDQATIAFALDAGAAGVVVPRVEDGTAARSAASAARFPPLGSRGVGPSRASGFGAAIDEYVQAAQAQVLVCVQVETSAGVEHVDEIASTEGVDLVFLGLGDLAASLQLDARRDAAVLQESATAVIERSRDRGKLTGIFSATTVDAEAWLDQGVSLVIVASDLNYLAAAASEAGRRLRRR